jgi:hypothetical protein
MTKQSTKVRTEQNPRLSDLAIFQGSYVSGEQPSEFTEQRKQGSLLLRSDSAANVATSPQAPKRDR